MKKTMLAAVAAALVCVAVVLGIYPADRTVWCVEMVWAVGLWAVLLLTRRRTSSATPSARIHAILAREADKAVVFRRGPSSKLAA